MASLAGNVGAGDDSSGGALANEGCEDTESNLHEAFVSTPDDEVLTPPQLMLEMLFSKFDVDKDGALNFEEFSALDAATEDEPQPMNQQQWAQILQIIKCDETSMDLDDFTLLYIGAEDGGFADLFGTDLHADFAAVFPEEARVSMVFEAFDVDKDGLLTASEFNTLLSARAHSDTSLSDEKFSILCEGNRGISLSRLIDIYLDVDEKSADIVEEVFGENNLDEDVKIAAVRLGLT